MQVKTWHTRDRQPDGRNKKNDPIDDPSQERHLKSASGGVRTFEFLCCHPRRALSIACVLLFAIFSIDLPIFPKSQFHLLAKNYPHTRLWYRFLDFGCD